MKKSYAFKRTLAGVLAVLTVAAYVPANVGAFKTAGDFGLVASAADEYQTLVWKQVDASNVVLSDVSDYLNSISDGTTTITNFKADNSKGLIKGKEITVVSQIPLTIGDLKDYTLDDIATPADDDNKTTEQKKENYDAGKTFKLDKKNGNYVYTFYLTKDIVFDILSVSVAVTNADMSVDGADSFTGTSSESEKKLLKELQEGTKKLEIKAVSDAKIGGSAIGSTLAVGRMTKQKITSENPFRAYVVGESVETFNAEYDAKTASFVCEVTIPDVDAFAPASGAKYNDNDFKMQHPWVVLSAIDATTEVYSYKADGNKLFATGTGVNSVEVASIKATIPDPDNKTKTIELTEGQEVANGEKVTIDFLALTQFVTSKVTNGSDKALVSVKKDGASFVDKNNLSWTGVTIVDDGSTVKGYNLKGDSDNETAAKDEAKKVKGQFIATDAGKYDVEMALLVDGKNSTVESKTVKFSFIIAAKDKMVESNIQISVPGIKNKDGSAVAVQATTYTAKASGIVDIIVPDDYDGKESIVFGADNGDTALTIVADDTTTPITYKTLDQVSPFITVAPFNKDGDLDTAKRLTKFYLDGTTQSNKTGRINTMNVYITDAEYGGSVDTPAKISFNWRLVKESDKNVWKWAENSTMKSGNAVTVGEDEANTLKDLIFDNIVLNQYSENEISFEYLPGKDLHVEGDDMDERTKGLPTKKGEYSVYFVVDGEAVSTINVIITAETIRAAVPSAQLTKDFGQLVNLKGYYFKDADGKKIDPKSLDFGSNTLINAIYHAELVKDKKTGKVTDQVATDDKTGKYLTLGGNLLDDDADPKTANLSPSEVILAPGKYIVEIGGFVATDKAAEKEYTIGKKQYIVTVNKKKLTADMVLIEPLVEKSSSQNLDVTKLKATFKDELEDTVELKLLKTGGDTTGTKAGKYNVTVEASSGANSFDPTAYHVIGYADYSEAESTTTPTQSKMASDYLEGEIEVPWYIVNNGTEKSALAFNESKTTLYDAGRIHFEVYKEDTISGKYKRMGIILDKNGLIPAPKDGSSKISASEYALARSVLQVGNGLTEGEQGEEQFGTNKYGVNVKVVSVETGAWARPYIEMADGTIYYGKPIYRNITEEATEKLQLKLANPTSGGLSVYDADDAASVLAFEGKPTATPPVAPTAATYQKAVTKQSLIDEQLKKTSNKKTEEELRAEYVGSSDIKCGYNVNSGKYYIYSSMKKLDSSVKANVVQSGVVYDKFGLIGKDGKLASDTAVNVDKALRLENGLDLTQDKNKGKKSIGIGIASKTNTALSGQEYGANITPADGVTGVWVRGYVQLSSTLVIYTDPVYIQDLSSHYIFNTTATTPSQAVLQNAFTATNIDSSTTPAKAQAKALFDFTVKGSLPENLTFKKAGVVYDTKGKFLKYESGTQKYTFTSDLMKDAKTALVLNNGFQAGGKSEKAYEGSLTPKPADNGTMVPIVARGYITFTTKDGNEITIYSNVYAVNTLTDSLDGAAGGYVAAT